MNLLTETRMDRCERLLRKNIFNDLSYEQQESIKEGHIEFALKLAADLEKQMKVDIDRSGIKFDFIYDMRFGAKTSLHSDYIGVVECNLGTLIQLYDFFYSIDTSDAFTHESEKETVNELMVNFAMKFIIAHEIAHVFMGHLDLYREYVVKDLIIDIQTLEADADIFAINKLIEWVYALVRIDFKVFKKLNYKNAIWFIVLGSIHGLYYLLRETDELDTFDSAEHPPMIIRESISLGVFTEVVNNDLGDDLLNVIKLFEEKFNRVFNVDAIEHQLFVDKYNSIKLYGDDLLKNWRENISKEQSKYSLLPINSVDY